MCGGIKYYPGKSDFTIDELTLLIGMVMEEQNNQIHCLKIVNMTEGDFKLSKSIVRLEALLKKLEYLRSGYVSSM
jgi:hypothetical protein